MFRNIKEVKTAMELKVKKAVTEDNIIGDWECSVTRRTKIPKNDENIYLHCYLPTFETKKNKINFKFSVIFSAEVGALFGMKRGDRVNIKFSKSNPSLILVEKSLSENIMGTTKITGNSKSLHSLRIQFQKAENFPDFPTSKRWPLMFGVAHDNGFILDTSKIIS